VLAVTDASGAIIASREYRPYGAPFIAQGDMERSFGGHVEDSEVGLVYMQARFYDPQVGRFLSIDPFDLREGEVRQAGHYHFGLNNPLSYTDPTGMSACSMFEALKCNADGGERRMQDGRDRTREFVALDQTQGGGDSHRPGCDTAECDEVKGTRAKIMADSADTLEAAGIYGAKEAAAIGVGGIIGRVFGRLTALLRIGGPAVSYATKIEGQLLKRGWTKTLVEQAVRRPARTVATQDVRFLASGGRMNDPATAYYSRSGGYVVRNDVTGDIVQISNRNDPGWKAPWGP
jgi:RHS repeat-associated protein